MTDHRLPPAFFAALLGAAPEAGQGLTSSCIGVLLHRYSAMIITLDRNSGAPVFRQIVDQVRFQAAVGVLTAGAEVPSTRELAAILGINPMTVSKAYSLLELEGVLERRPGLALVVHGSAGAGGRGTKRAELTRLLGPVAIAARQLGVPADEAIELFRDLLHAKGDRS
jgi:GntR family transcriptional regulator